MKWNKLIGTRATTMIVIGILTIGISIFYVPDLDSEQIVRFQAIWVGMLAILMGFIVAAVEATGKKFAELSERIRKLERDEDDRTD